MVEQNNENDSTEALSRITNILNKNAGSKQSSQNTSAIELSDGEELSPESAQRILGRSQTRVIVLAGDSDSGKTTLLSAIYERFLRGTLADFSFAGSQTLMGFERRSWRARISSNSKKAETDRTRSGEQNLLHFLVCPTKNKANSFQDMILLDISGEDYRDARTSDEACLKLEKLKRADHFALLIDGEKILNMAQRHEALRNSKQLLKRLLDNSMLSPKVHIHILITKYDKIKPLETTPAIRDFLQNTENIFQETFTDKVGNVNFCKIASRPRYPSELSLGHGFENFFPQWVLNTSFNYDIESSLETSSINPIREFDKYSSRRQKILMSNTL